MITKERLLEIVGDSSAVKQSIWPNCCPWCSATKSEIEEMAQNTKLNLAPMRLANAVNLTMYKLHKPREDQIHHR